MKISDIYLDAGNDPRLRHWCKTAEEAVTRFVREVSGLNNLTCSCQSTVQVYRKVFHNLCGTFKEVTGKRLYVTQANKLSVKAFLENESKRPWPYRYRTGTFDKLLKMEAGMMLAKGILMVREQVTIAALSFLINYFRPYTTEWDGKETWNFDIRDVMGSIDSLNNMEIDEIVRHADKSLHESMRQMVVQRRSAMDGDSAESIGLLKKPLKAEHLTFLWSHLGETTQAQKIEKVMEYWDVSRNTAVNYMKRFGLYTSRFEKQVEKQGEVIRLLDENLRLREAIKEKDKIIAEMTQKLSVLSRSQSCSAIGEMAELGSKAFLNTDMEAGKIERGTSDWDSIMPEFMK